MQKDRFYNRELSWLKFNERVLQEASDPQVPLIERLRFLGIFSNNLDEFFRVRYALIKRISQAGKSGKKLLGGFRASDLLKEITQIVINHQTESLKILHKIQSDLKQHNIHIVKEDEVNEEQGQFVKHFFIEKISPALVTIMLNDLQEVPNLQDSAVYLAVKLVQKEEDNSLKNRYSLIQIPTNVNRFVVLPSIGKDKYVMLVDDLIRYNLDLIFNIFTYESISANMIKITRDAQLDIEGDLGKSYVEKLMKSVNQRLSGDAVRFVYDKTIENDTLEYLLPKLGIDNKDSLIPGGRYHNRRDYMKFPDLGAKHLLYSKIEPLPISGLILQGSLLKEIAHRDFLQFTPYQTFSYTVKFLREAALDPKVVAIKITIYRLAEISHIASSLINAAKNGKEVTVSIELQARFDEANNIRYSEKMQREGINLIFGVSGLKVHSKACLIHRLEHGKVKRYGFISTGNFNENTAKIYTDYTLFTSHNGILKDLEEVFGFFEINYKINKYKHLVVSPHFTRKFFNRKIDQQIKLANEGKHCGILFKMNSLSDYKMIAKLYEASRAGVKIKLIVRGICCLIPGVKGFSENIKAISVIDKFLEHPRLYIFNTPEEQEVFISSADLMTRNLDYRVEITCPIYDDAIKQELIDTFDISWNDNVKARDLSTENNQYIKTNNKPLRSQFATYDYYKAKV